MKSPETRYNEIKPLIENGRQEAAISALEKLVEAYPDFAQAHHDLGTLYDATEDWEAARRHYQAAIDRDPDNAAGIKRLAELVYTRLGDLAQALVHFKRALEIQPQDVETLLICGNLSVVQHRFDEAQGFYRRVLDIEPWNRDAASSLEKLGRAKPEGMSAANAEVMYERGRELYRTGDIAGAIQQIEKLVAAHPGVAAAHNDLGVMYYQSGAKDKVMSCYEKAARLEPANKTYQKNLADFYCIEMGRIQDALEIYFRVLSEDPADIDSLMAAGQICEVLNQLDDAKVFYDRVLDIEPWNIEASEKLNNLSAQ